MHVACQVHEHILRKKHSASAECLFLLCLPIRRSLHFSALLLPVPREVCLPFHG